MAHYITKNMTALAKSIIAQARAKRYPDFRGLDAEPRLIVDDVVIPRECYPSNIKDWSYNYISKTFNNMWAETSVDWLVNMRMRVDWEFDNVDEAVHKYWMGLINARILGKKDRKFKVNLYMPGMGWVESIWNTGAPISGSAVSGSGHDGIIGHPGSSYYTSDNLLPGNIAQAYDPIKDAVVQSRYYGSRSTDANIKEATYGVVDTVKFEIHWSEMKGIRLNKITDIKIEDLIPEN